VKPGMAMGLCALATLLTADGPDAASFAAFVRDGVALLDVNVISDPDQLGNVDGRGSLPEKAKELGLSDAEVARIRASSGYVICPGKTYGNPSVGSGALVGSNKVVITALHIFIDDAGRKREPLRDCYFAPQIEGSTDPQRWQIFRFSFKIDEFQFGKTGDPIKTGDPNDYAVVALETPVEGAVPFPFDPDEIAPNEWVLGLTATQESPTRTFDREEPVIQQCRLRGRQHPHLAPVQYITDCDLSPLGSGGTLLTRNETGALVVRGIFISTGKPKLNGRAYDPKAGSLTRVVSTTGPFAEAINDVVRALKGAP